MCFDKRSARQKPRKAKTDIIAFKRLKSTSGSLESPCYSMYWKIGKVVTSQLVENPRNKTEIETGLHCYRTKEIADKNWTGCITVPVIIPKGATFYANNNEIVATKMILVSDRVDDTLEVIKMLIKKSKR